jgi:hypothetical protein
MSIVIATDAWPTVAPVVRRLGALPSAAQIELVVALPRGTAGAPDDEVRPFARAQVVEVDAVPPLGAARAAGVRAATAPFVFMGETHSFLEDGAVESLVAAHEPGWAVVVPAISNANPDGATSWAGFLAGYAAWAEGQPPGEVANAPIYNVSYRRDVLLDLGARLPALLTEGEDMIAALRSGGYRLRFEPSAHVAHANMSRPWPWLHQRLLAGRAIAGTRSTRWPATRRAAYALGAPLIPFVLLSRSRRGIATTMRRHHLPRRVLLGLVAGAIAEALGELLGYALGEDPAWRRRYDEYEVRRLEHVTGAGLPR